MGLFRQLAENRPDETNRVPNAIVRQSPTEKNGQAAALRRPLWRRELKKLRYTAIGPLALAPLRLLRATRYYTPKLRQMLTWLCESREEGNYTYGITERNQIYLAHMLSVVSGCAYESVLPYLREPLEDLELRRHVVGFNRKKPYRYYSDARCEFGRRIGWYAMARLMKPETIVETGVDKGLGAVLLCSALLRNAREGFPGRYFGTDIDPQAGYLLAPPYDSVGQILYGDSIGSLKRIEAIDLLIHDSDYSPDYERREYQAVAPKLTRRAVILGNKAHSSDELALFSEKHGRQFLFLREEPRDHWYPGAGIGFSYPPPGNRGAGNELQN
jgi:Methyltransferase domain